MLGLALLVLALRSTDLAALAEALREARYGWVAPLVAVALVSHLIRAWRWKLIISALPADSGRRPRLFEAFGSLMVGYMVNYAAPRLGEVARAGVLSRRTKTSFAALLGTVAAERILDVATLLLALLSVVLLLRSRFIDVLGANRPGLSPAWLIVLMIVVVVAGTAALWFFRRTSREQAGSWLARSAIVFLDGLKAVLLVRPRALLFGQTAAIWVCYWIMAFIPLNMLGLTSTYTIGFPEAWSLMNLGSIGVLIPSPGGIGSYHFITVEALTGLFSVHPSSAASYAVLTHGVQLVTYVIAGFVALLLLGVPLKSAVGEPGTEGMPEDRPR